MDTGLCKHCPNCNKRKHSSVAYFCELCGTELINEPKREFCLRLRIPNSKIDIEQEQKTTISVFPFLLRKKDETSVQAVLIRDYPICKHLIKDIHTMRKRNISINIRKSFFILMFTKNTRTTVICSKSIFIQDLNMASNGFIYRPNSFEKNKPFIFWYGRTIKSNPPIS